MSPHSSDPPPPTDDRSTDRGRIALRPAVPRDADLLWRWRGETSVRRFQPLRDLGASQLRADIANQRIHDLYRGRGEKFQWVVLATDEPAGWITLVISNWEHGVAEIGYALATAFQRQGLMPIALELLVDLLFSRTTLERLEARCAVDNRASARVLEQCGFQREGRLREYFRLRGERVDNYLFARLRTDNMPEDSSR